MVASTSPQVSSAVAYDGEPACMSDDTTMPSSVQASTSMCGYTLRWLMRRSSGSRANSRRPICVRSRMSTSAWVSASRAANSSTSSTWSVNTVTSWPSSFSKHDSVRSVSNQSSRIATFMGLLSSAGRARYSMNEDSSIPNRTREQRAVTHSEPISSNTNALAARRELGSGETGLENSSLF